MSELNHPNGVSDGGLIILMAAPLSFITIVGGGSAWLIVSIVRALLT